MEKKSLSKRTKTKFIFYTNLEIYLLFIVIC